MKMITRYNYNHVCNVKVLLALLFNLSALWKKFQTMNGSERTELGDQLIEKIMFFFYLNKTNDDRFPSEII